MSEIWKPVRGFQGRYEVSDQNHIKSLPKLITRRQNKKSYYTKKRLIFPSLHESGYMRINLRKNNKTSSHYVHNLVLEAFVCKRPNKQDGDHIDKNRTNNKLKNLRWLPRILNRGKRGSANPNSRVNQFRRNGYIRNGELVHLTKLTTKQVVRIKMLLKAGIPNTVIAKKFPVTPDNISKIKRGHSWSHIQ